MLTTFVIGLREGLEASLIVGIIAAFLKRNGGDGATRALRQMWIGIGLAITLCLAGGVTLALISEHLPQRQQEMLECVVAAVAVVMVTYMILWMSSHSRGLKGELESAAAGALARGSAFALVVMAFLAVLREGFETSVFLLAAFGAAVSPVAAAAGVVLGLASAVLLGYLIYRGGTRINLSRFFRLTGVVLVLVAGGLVMSTLQAAHEAAWLTAGQQGVLDLSWLVRPGSIPASLIGGVLGIQAQPAVVQVTAWLLYVIPMLAVVLWPRSHRLTRPAAGRLLLAAGSVVGVLAVALFSLVPGGTNSATTAFAVAGTGPVRAAEASADQDFTGSTDVRVLTVAGGSLTADVTASAGTAAGTPFATFAVQRTVDFALVGTTTIGGVTANRYEAASISGPTTAPGLPATISGADVAAINGGRLPIGLTVADTDAELAASFVDSWRATVVYDPDSGVVLDAQLRLVRSLQVVNSTGLSISVGTIADVTTGATAAAQADRVAAALSGADRVQRHQIWGQVVPTVMAVAAVVLLAAGLVLLLRRPARPAPVPPQRVPEPVGSR